MNLTSNEWKAIGADIISVKFGWPIGVPTVRNKCQGLWE